MAQQTCNPILNSTLGEPVTFKGLTVFPLAITTKAGPDYLTLGQAMHQELLVVTEVTESGSVPDLKVQNKSDRPVLLIDGEELFGAKQNRVLNISMLLKENSDTIVPVSCTEQGRWSYISSKFADSGTVMSPSLRHHKTRSVSEYMRSTGSRQSDQGKLWSEINKLSLKARVRSKTGAMRDIYESRQEKLKEYVKSIPLQEGQTGILVLISGQVVGFDHISRPVAFADLYPKLLESYAMDAVLSNSDCKTTESEQVARDFLREASLANKSVHESIGYGTDCRFTGDNVVGSALEVGDSIVHIAFFASNPSVESDRMSNSRRRRGFRQ